MASTSSLEYFKSNFLKKGLAKPSRYEIEFEGPGKTNLSMPAETVTLPSRSFVTVMEQWYGPERQIPVGNKFDSSVIITFPVSTDQSERTFFEEWMNTILSNIRHKAEIVSNDFYKNADITPTWPPSP